MRAAVLAALLVAGCPNKKDTTPAPDPGPPLGNVAAEPARPDRPAGWERYSSVAGGFEVDFPGHAVESSQMLDTASGQVELHLVMLDLQTSAVLVGWQVQPPSAPTDPVEVLDGQRDGMMGALPGARILEQADIKLGAHPGRRMTVKLAGDQTQYSRVYLVGGKLYQLAQIAYGDGDAATAEQFFASFTLVAK